MEGGTAVLTVADVMTREVVTVGPETSVPEIAQILHAKRISGVPVVAADGSVVGIVSEGDLMGHALAVGEQRGSWWLTFFSDNSALARDYTKTHGRIARDVMTREVISIAPTASLAETARTLERNRIKRVPVIDNGKLVGIVTRANLLQALATVNVSQAASVDDRTIRERLLAELEPQPWVHLLSKNIIVQDGVVHLWGMVATEAERHALRLAAENTPGVKKVEDHLSRYPVKIGGAS
jgi:CBS-domain-containing membrane protein